VQLWLISEAVKFTEATATFVPQPAQPTLTFGRPVRVMLGSMAGGRRPFCVPQAAIGSFCKFFGFEFCTAPAPFQFALVIAVLAPGGASELS
jgi:hypothetical protein